MASNCPENRFECTNQRCVTGDSLCDGQDDCGDNSDETVGCKGQLKTNLLEMVRRVKLSKFKKYLQFITKYCDIYHEWHAQIISNISGFLLGHCPSDHYRCSDKRCIRTSKVCDGYKDCSDNGDEVNGCKGTLWIYVTVLFEI